jgi:hypothetical protein
MNILEIYEKCRSGDPISDEELDYGIVYLKDLEKKLNELGPVFLLPWKEVARILDLLEAFKFARNGMKDL